ncbi:CHAT domain-containing protein, partial [Caldilinea sp.]|uniref:CHAT domain-containing protein n=1 Tax=Caldilinea sp. TaxID=2293560 RepID=UPI001B243E8D
MSTQPPSVHGSGQGSIAVGGGVSGSLLVTGSQNVIIQAGEILLRLAEQARAAARDPGRMLRILAVLAAPVHDPADPDHPPPPLDLRREWNRLERAVREANAPILLARLTPPTLEALRRGLSPRTAQQGLFPQVLHFSGHAWREGLLLEDEDGQTRYVTAAELLQALRPPRPLDLVVLNACESAADARSAGQALVQAGLARAVVGHLCPVRDDQAIAFARTLYTDLSDGFPLREAVERARRHITPT